MPKRRHLLVLATLCALSACATVEKFSFENTYHDLVALVTDGLKTSVPEHSEESENLEENPKTAVVPKDDEPASWLIKNGCKLNSVTVDSDGSRTWKLRCPNSRWVTLVDTNLQ